jgi:hypothetical protein
VGERGGDQKESLQELDLILLFFPVGHCPRFLMATSLKFIDNAMVGLLANQAVRS